MRSSLRLPIVLVAAVVVAEGAVLLLRPAEPLPEPVSVDERAYFSAAQLQRARDFRTGQLWLAGAALVVELGVLVLLVRRPPPALTRRYRRPVLAGAAAAAVLSVAVGVAALPISAVARERARDVGLVTQSWAGWASDVVKSQAIGAVFAAAGGAVLVVALRRFGRGWWLPGAVVVVGFGVVTTYAAPIVIEPVFNDFKALPAGAVRSDVLRLAGEAGVEVGEVYEVDASRRTTGANAYVAGLGRTKRVVLYDNLLSQFSADEVRSVIAHELAHVRYDDVPRGLLYLAIVAPFGLLAVARLAERFAPHAGAGPAALPAVALSIVLVVPVITTISNQLSRRVEARADAYALSLTDDPAALIGLQRRLTVENVSDPDPPGLVSVLLRTHPTTVERIGAAEAFARRVTPGAALPPARPRTPEGS